MTNDFNIKPYELSLWDDSVQDGQIKEIKKCVISSHTMNSAAKAYNINLTRKVNGERQLTFTICARYYDETSGEEVLNPYLKLLTNERKVKLRQEKNGKNVWYDFIIKNVSEDSSNDTYTYTAKDQHVQELSKNGFNIVFDKELRNNTKTATEFAEEILKGTDWNVEETEQLIEYIDEPLYRVHLAEGIVLEAKQLLEPYDTITLGDNGIHTFYIPYSVIQNKEPFFQILASAQYPDEVDVETLPKDDEGILSRDIFQNYYITNAISYGSSKLPNDFIGDLFYGCRGSRIVRQPHTEYDNILERYVNIYRKEDSEDEYCGFTKIEYRTPDFVQSIITNGRNMENITGWGRVWEGTKQSQIEFAVNPPVKDWSIPDDGTAPNVTTYIKATGPIFNHGFFDHKYDIGPILEGQEFIFSHTTFTDLEGENQIEEAPDILICDYKTEGAFFLPKPDAEPYFEIVETRQGGSCVLKCIKAIDTEENMKKSKIGIFIRFSDDYLQTVYLKEASLYRRIIDEEGKEVEPLSEVSAEKLTKEQIIKTKYFYFKKQENPTYKDEETLPFVYQGFDDNPEFILQYRPTYEKRRTITAKESNRFNLLQKVCETFEIWLDIQVEHDEIGRITNKKVAFKEYIGTEKYNGFKYGINLNSIKRTVDSDKIVSKLIVKQNSNEFGKNGFCTIARAPSNPSGTNVIYNFDYYISQGLLNQKDTETALYDSENGLYSKLLTQTKVLRDLADQIIGVSKNIVNLEATVETEEAKLLAAEDLAMETRKDLEDLTTFTYEQLCRSEQSLKRQQFEENKIRDDPYYFDNERPTDKLISEYAEMTDKTVEEVKSWLENEQWSKDSIRDVVETVAQKVFLDWKESDRIIPYMTKILVADKTIVEAEKNLENAKIALGKYEDELVLLQENQNEASKIQETEEQNFFKIYGRFIQEGSWISEDYTDDNLYYLDALSTLYTSAKPQVSYTINVFDMADIEGYENYNFDIGDKTFVEDTEFFGWTFNKDGAKSPYREEVIISEIVEGIDDPAKNNLKIQNYKTQFDDLFQRIAAATEQLQYNTGRYERFTNAVEQDGSISYAALQQTVNENGLAIANAGAQTVSCDERGIITIDKTMPAKQVRIIGGGIYLTTDGGETWKTGITGEGINANTITTGQLNAGEVNIMTDTAPSHKWDNKGITAYKTSYNISDGKINSVNNATFVRFDEFGFYGIKDNADFYARPKDNNDATHGVEKIKQNAAFSFTWDGVTIGKPGVGLEATEDKLTIGGDRGLAATGDKMTIGGDNGFIATSDNVTIGGEGGITITPSIITIGGLKGINITDKQITIGGDSGLVASDKGLSIGQNFVYGNKDGLSIGSWKVNELGLIYGTEVDDNFRVVSGGEGHKLAGNIGTSEKGLNWSIIAGKTFGVTVDGKLYASSANLSGTITATDGSIGGIEITEKNGIRTSVEPIWPKQGVDFPIQHTVPAHLTSNASNNLKITNWGQNGWYNYYYDVSGKEGQQISVKAGKGVAEFHFLKEMPKQSAEDGYYYATCISHVAAATAAAQILTIPTGATVLIVNQQQAGDPTVQMKGGFSISANGEIIANSVKLSGELSVGAGSTIGSFEVDGNSIYSGTWGTSAPDVFMCSGTTGTYTIAGVSLSDWAIGIGGRFGVTATGNVYCDKICLSDISNGQGEQLELSSQGFSYTYPGGGDAHTKTWASFFGHE